MNTSSDYAYARWVALACDKRCEHWMTTCSCKTECDQIVLDAWNHNQRRAEHKSSALSEKP